MTAAEARLLLSYNGWANRRLLRAAASLPRQLMKQNLATSHTSIWGTLVHMAWGEWRWLGRWRTGAATVSNPDDSGSLAVLEACWAEITRQQLAFIDQLGATELDGLISYDNLPGTTWTYALGEMVRHVVYHSTYHRGQVASLLRQLGLRPLRLTIWSSSMRARQHRPPRRDEVDGAARGTADSRYCD